MSMQRWINKPDGSNWGRFGPDDQRGKMNLLTPERRVAAAREVKEGLAFWGRSLLDEALQAEIKSAQTPRRAGEKFRAQDDPLVKKAHEPARRLDPRITTFGRGIDGSGIASSEHSSHVVSPMVYGWV